MTTEHEIAFRDIKAGKHLQLGAAARHRVKIRTEEVPVIVVPGVMGSRLWNRTERRQSWDPDAAIFSLRHYAGFWTTPVGRQISLLGTARVCLEDTAVHENDADHNEAFSKEYPAGVERGWGGVSWAFYGSLLKSLSAERWSYDPFVKHPVWACGYDWRLSTKIAGQYLKRRIAKIRAAAKNCPGVVLLTHSMGGLVARSAMQQGADADVLGVVHAVQPAAGAPVAWWRIKAGVARGWNLDEIKLAWAIGANAREYTSLYANLPGPLQLLPTTAYVDEKGQKQWLAVTDPEGRKTVNLPASDPYAEIYSVMGKDFWNIDPEDIVGEKDEARTQGFVKRYLRNIDQAKNFHDGLGTYLHPNTRHLAGTGLKTVSRVEFTIEHRRPLTGNPKFPKQPAHFSAGEYREYLDDQHRAVLKPADGDGDATVPTPSAKRLGTPEGPGQVACFPEAEHGACFASPRFLAATLRAVSSVVHAYGRKAAGL